MVLPGIQRLSLHRHDRRGHGRSSQPWRGNDMDTYADDLSELIESLDLTRAVMIGFSAGGGEVARYIGRHGTKRVARAALISSVPPLMLKTAANPPACRSRHSTRSASPQSPIARSSTRTSPAARSSGEQGRRQGLAGHDGLVLAPGDAGRPQEHLRLHQGVLRDGLHEDLGKFDVPTLVLHGDDDQIVPIAASALRSSKLVRNAALKIYPGAPHGLAYTHKEKLNADLLAFLKDGAVG